MSLAKDVQKDKTLKYERHKPEKTLLYQIVIKCYPQFLAHLAEHGKDLPKYVRTEFEGYLKCDCLEHGKIR